MNSVGSNLIKNNTSKHSIKFSTKKPRITKTIWSSSAQNITIQKFKAHYSSKSKKMLPFLVTYSWIMLQCTQSSQDYLNSKETKLLRKWSKSRKRGSSKRKIRTALYFWWMRHKFRLLVLQKEREINRWAPGNWIHPIIFGRRAQDSILIRIIQMDRIHKAVGTVSFSGCKWRNLRAPLRSMKMLTIVLQSIGLHFIKNRKLILKYSNSYA